MELKRISIDKNSLTKLQGGGNLPGQSVYIPLEQQSYAGIPMVENEWYKLAPDVQRTSAPPVDTEGLSKIKGHSNYVNGIQAKMSNAQNKISQFLSENPYATIPPSLLKDMTVDMSKINEAEKDYEYTKQALETSKVKKNSAELVFIPDKGGFLATNLKTGKDEWISPDKLATNKDLYKTMTYGDFHSRRDESPQYINDRDSSNWLTYGKGKELVVNDIDEAFKGLGKSGSESEGEVYKMMQSPAGAAEMMKFSQGSKGSSNAQQIQTAMQSVFLRLGSDAKAQLQAEAYSQVMQNNPGVSGEALHKAAQDIIYQTIAKTGMAKLDTFSGSKQGMSYDAGFSKARTEGAGVPELPKLGFYSKFKLGDASLELKGITMHDTDSGKTISGHLTGIPKGENEEQVINEAITGKSVDGKTQFKTLAEYAGSNLQIRGMDGRPLHLGEGKLQHMDKMVITGYDPVALRIPVNPDDANRITELTEHYRKILKAPDSTAEQRAIAQQQIQILPQTVEARVYLKINVAGQEKYFTDNSGLQVKNPETNKLTPAITYSSFGKAEFDRKAESAFGVSHASDQVEKATQERFGTSTWTAGDNSAIQMPVYVEMPNSQLSDPAAVRHQADMNLLFIENQKRLQQAQGARVKTNSQPMLQW